MLSRIMYAMSKHCQEFIFIFIFQTVVLFLAPLLFNINAVCVTILCILYGPLVSWVIPVLPKWATNRVKDLPKFNLIQLCLCGAYTAFAWMPLLLKP